MVFAFPYHLQQVVLNLNSPTYWACRLPAKAFLTSVALVKLVA